MMKNIRGHIFHSHVKGMSFLFDLRCHVNAWKAGCISKRAFSSPALLNEKLEEQLLPSAPSAPLSGVTAFARVRGGQPAALEPHAASLPGFMRLLHSF